MPTLEQVLETYPETVKVVFKHFPLNSHPFALKAAQATVAAGLQGKFWPFHDQIFQNYQGLSDAMIQKIATDLGLDLETFQKGMKSPETTAAIQKDMRDAGKAGVRGTPSVYVNGRRLKNRDLNGFKAAIDQALKALEAPQTQTDK